MPQRTNEFQKLVKLIHDQLTPTGATVNESAMVRLRPNEEPSEIDVFIEQEMAGQKVRIALECRDNGSQSKIPRPGDKSWIQQICGKYRNSRIQPVAVHSVGFTKGAKEVAVDCAIQLLTLYQAERTDWKEKLSGNQIILVSSLLDRISLRNSEFATERPPSAIGPDIHLIKETSSSPIVTLDEFIDSQYRQYIQTQTEHALKSYDMSELTSTFAQNAPEPIELKNPIVVEVKAFKFFDAAGNEIPVIRACIHYNISVAFHYERKPAAAFVLRDDVFMAMESEKFDIKAVMRYDPDENKIISVAHERLSELKPSKKP